MNGCFITFEGGEGAGKSTMIGHARRWLEAHGHDVVQTREPGGTPLAERIRELVLDPAAGELDRAAELLLVFAARAQHLGERIRPALQEGCTVLCDRFTDATWAYQGAGRSGSEQLIATLEEAVHGDLQPHLTILLDLPVETGMARREARGAADRIERESVAFFDRVRRNYLERAAASPERFAVIDARADEASVRQAVEAVLAARVPSPGDAGKPGDRDS